MDLVLLGTADTASADEMLTYAREIARENHPWLGCWCWEAADETIQMVLAEKVCSPLCIQ
jgi:hypothetical protein